MEALVLAAALMTVDAEVRQSCEFALAGELGRFPHPAIVDRDKAIAFEHLEWLERRFEMGPLASAVTQENVEEQKQVIRFYNTLRNARYYSAESFARTWSEPLDEETHSDEPYRGFCCRMAAKYAAWLREQLGEDYHAGCLPAPVTCQRR